MRVLPRGEPSFFLSHSLIRKGVIAMPILLAAGKDGLWEYRDTWRALPCPLSCPTMIARDGPRFALLDEDHHALWTGQSVMNVDSGVEAMLFWREYLLLLSGDTDCLTLVDQRTGTSLLTTPAGVYPQDMCILPGGRVVAVCGGAEGTLRLIRLPDLTLERLIRLPGNVQRIACAADCLLTLCALEDDGLCCLMCRVPFQGRAYEPVLTLPGLPGAVHVDDSGGWWVAASEALCRVYADGTPPASIRGDFGLIRSMDSRAGALLTADPVLGLYSRVQGGAACVLYEGDVRDARLI